MFLILIGLISAFNIYAGEEWWQLPRVEDEKNYYYVGIAEGQSRGGSYYLQDLAFNKAMGELIREHFGMSIQMTESALEELQDESYQVVTKQSSAPLFIKGVSQFKTKELSYEKSTRVYVQIRVNKASLSESIKQQKLNASEVPLSTYGESNEAKIDVTVKTIPSGAIIHFAHMDKRYSIQGQGDGLFYLPRGRYQMVISKPGYTVVTKEIKLLASGRVEIINLRAINMKLHLRLEPEDAKIEYLGKIQNGTVFNLQVTKSHRFQFSHPDYLSQVIEVNYQYPDSVTREVTLEPKASTLRYEVDPRGASIYIDDHESKSIDGKIYIQAGTKKIRITKKGYNSFEEEIAVGPNRDYPLKVIQLRISEKKNYSINKKIKGRFEYNPFITHEEKGYFALIPIAFHLEWYYVSLGIGYNWINKQESDSSKITRSEFDSKQAVETNYHDANLTLRLISPEIWRSKIYLSKTIGSIRKSDSNKNKEEVASKLESYDGIGAGLRFYINPKWSIHGEHMRLNFKDKETDLKRSDERTQIGIGYEF